MKTNIFYISIFLFFSCIDKPPVPIEKKESVEFLNGAVYKNPYKWITTLSTNTQSKGNIQTPINYKQGALCFSFANNTLYLTMLNAKDGSVRWVAPRKIRNNLNYFDVTFFTAYQKDNYLINSFIANGYDGIENIDLETGETLWESTISNSIWKDWSPLITGVDSLFFFPGRPINELDYGYHHTTIYCGNTANGNIRPLVVPPYPNYNPATDSLVLELIAPIKLYNKTHILMGYTCNDTAFVALYNKDDNNWLYKNKLIGKNMRGCLQFTVFSENRFYITPIANNGGYMICGNLETGDVLWDNKDFGVLRNTVEYKDLLIGVRWSNYNNSKSGIGAINKYTGKEVWRIDKEPSHFLYVYDGVVYFENSSLHAIDAETGKKYWHLTPNEGGDFMYCSVVETGDKDGAMIVGCSGADAYGYLPVDKNLQAPK